MALHNRVSTGMSGFDEAIDYVRLGDNVVWQVGSVSEYQTIVDTFAKATRESGRKLVYCRFGKHEPLLDDKQADCSYLLEPERGFEHFTTQVSEILNTEGKGVFYVFDSLSDLLEHWYSDLMIGNFFQVTCPALYDLETVAYFALVRGTHLNTTIARIRGTTQVLLDLYRISDKCYIHPLKVLDRYSPSMFFPHLIEGDAAISVTASAEAALLFSGEWQLQQARDFWEITLDKAKAALSEGPQEQEQAKNLLIQLVLGHEPGIKELAKQYFTLADLLYVASREIGTGRIGGKSVGFLLARQIVRAQAPEELLSRMEPHDSYYVGSDVFYTYIVQNGCWDLRMQQKSPSGYFVLANTLKEALLKGRFPENIREQFAQMLEYFGQSPIIVRSSSLQEDGYGNAFAGKYTSVFCANQGAPEDRLEALEDAVRTVYASIMNEDALRYRMDRGLFERDEQMAILVQRVSGDHYGSYFFPHVAGVANSVNLYLWDPEMDPSAGMLRLVFGLGTRAVDRISGDYARTVALDRPTDSPPVAQGDEAKFSQHNVDLLDLDENTITTIPINKVSGEPLRTKSELFFSIDRPLLRQLKEQGRKLANKPYITDFAGLLKHTGFAEDMEHILRILHTTYDYPVDVEFTGNFTQDGNYHINLLQCRPLQARNLESAGVAPKPAEADIYLKTRGNFMGGNLNTPIDFVFYVDPAAYLACTEQDKYQVARSIGLLTHQFMSEKLLLIGPGRWGTTTPSLGVPVHFSDISKVTVLCEMAYQHMMPEVSFGSHFFQDLVETGIFYIAMQGQTVFHPEILSTHTKMDLDWSESDWVLDRVIRVYETPGLQLYSNVSEQLALVYFV